MGLNYLSLFSGVGGMDLGLDRAGLTCIGQAEIDPHATKALQAHWPDVPRWKDVRDVRAADLPVRPDLLTGGFPCQDVSVAGKRAGLAGDRSGLWWEFARVIDESAPRWVLIENVVGLLSSNGGRDLGAICGWLGQRGYEWAWRVLDAQHFGVPQRRRRVFIVASRGAGASRRCVGALFPESEGVCWHPPSCCEAGPGAARGVAAGAGAGGVASALTGNMAGAGGGADDNTAQGNHLVVSAPIADTAPTITTTFGAKNYSNHQEVGAGSVVPVLTQPVGFHATQDPISRDDGTPALGSSGYLGVHADYAVRRLTPTECERLMGWPDGWTEPCGADGHRYKACGNGVVANVAEWIGRNMMEAGRW